MNMIHIKQIQHGGEDGQEQVVGWVTKSKRYGGCFLNYTL